MARGLITSGHLSFGVGNFIMTVDISMPTDLLYWERQLWDGGYRTIAGVDEVGRGALAGPLVAAAVILPREEDEDANFRAAKALIRDSKTLTMKRRGQIAESIHASGAAIGIGLVEPEEIDAIGINPANRTAMERAVFALPFQPDMLLIDALTLDFDTPQIGVIDGDAQSISIAAASIVAKVTRDCLMVEMHTSWPAYGFARHKGYGVASHLAALQEYGPCPQHRQCFAPVRMAQRDS
jgi:ribonuclease HII